MLAWLFGKKGARREADRVFMTAEAKWRALATETGVKLVAHFPASRRELQEWAKAHDRSVSVTLAGELLAPAEPDPNLRVMVIERHPLRERDDKVCEWADAAAQRITFNVSLDDALLASFAGSIRSVLERLGGHSDEVLHNAMLSRSIAGAQEKIRSRAVHDLPADSPEAWMRTNVTAER